eukprot:54614_1
MSATICIVTLHLLIMITCIKAQRVTLHSWPFTHNISGWQIETGNPTLVTDTKCPGASTCYRLIHNEEIYIYIDTRTYKDIQIGYDITTAGTTTAYTCEFYWTKGDALPWQPYWTNEAKHSENSTQHIIHTSLSSDLDDYSSIGLDFWATRGNQSCYLNNIVVTGIPITTAPTATMPTISPTAIPSEMPSAMPTLPTEIPSEMPSTLPTNAREGEVQDETDAYVTTDMDETIAKATDAIGIVEYVMYGSFIAAFCLCGGSTAVVIYCWRKKRAPQNSLFAKVPPVVTSVATEFENVMDDVLKVMNITKGKEDHANDDRIEDDMDLVPTMAEESEEGENEGSLDLTEAPRTPPIANPQDIDHGDLDLVPTLGSDECPPDSQRNDDVDPQIVNYMMTKT